jgi:hypothetical protein
MKNVKLLLFLFMSTILTATAGFAAEQHFQADLAGNDEVPGVDTPAKGEAKFIFSDNGQSVRYTIVVRDIENPTVAHIHLGAAGKSGPPVVNLFTGPKKVGKFRGNLVQASFMAKDLKGDLAGKTLNDLAALIKSGDVYVNVHTDANPDGEIRGQIK